MNGLFVVTNGILRNITRGRGNCEISQFLQAHLPPRKKKKEHIIILSYRTYRGGAGGWGE